MTDAEFQATILLLKRLGWLALVGALLLAAVLAAAGVSGAHTLTLTLNATQQTMAMVGVFCIIPALVYLVLLTIWHWKGRYRGTHSNLWGGLLIIETSGWFKIVYLFRHIIPDVRRTGRYAPKAK